MVKVYKDSKKHQQTFQRVFEHDVDENDLVWHRDHKHREIRVVKGDGWQFQMDNCMPVWIEPGDEFRVPAGVYHRIIRGFDDLILEIKES